MWYVYILECDDASLYVGMTDDVDRRFEQHLAGIGGQYTKRHKPIKVLYQEAYAAKVHAELREKQIKRWTRKKKLALTHGDFQQLKSLSLSRD